MKVRQILILIFLAMFSTWVVAGKTQPVSVNVDLTTLFAEGDQWTARTSIGDTEFIGCGVRRFDDGLGGATAFGFCQAEDAEGERAFCNTQNAALLDAIDSASDFGYLTFNWNEDGQCIRIGSSIQSFYLPEFKTK